MGCGSCGRRYSSRTASSKVSASKKQEVKKMTTTPKRKDFKRGVFRQSALKAESKTPVTAEHEHVPEKVPNDFPVNEGTSADLQKKPQSLVSKMVQKFVTDNESDTAPSE